MKYNKHSAIASLIFTIVPYISALITNYISLPFQEEFSFKIIMTTLFIISWFILLHIVSSLPDSLLQRLKLIKDSNKDIQKYWLVIYGENNKIACSILEIRDNCDSKSNSILYDYSLDLSIKDTFGIQRRSFDGFERLSQIYATGNNCHIYIRFVFVNQDKFNIFRVDDNDSDTTTRVTGVCYAITPEQLKDASICVDEKSSKKMLRRFGIGPQSKISLLKYVFQKKNTPYAMKILDACSKREKSEKKTHQQLDSFFDEPAKKKKVRVSKAKMGKV